MFEVTARYAIRDGWEDVDARIRHAAGCTPTFSGTDCKTRYHGFRVNEFSDAYRLRLKLEAVTGVRATIRET